MGASENNKQNANRWLFYKRWLKGNSLIKYNVHMYRDDKKFNDYI